MSGKRVPELELFDDLEKLSDVVDVKVYFFKSRTEPETAKYRYCLAPRAPQVLSQ